MEVGPERRRHPEMSDTIFAPATAAGRAAVAVVRLSGPQTAEAPCARWPDGCPRRGGRACGA